MNLITFKQNTVTEINILVLLSKLELKLNNWKSIFAIFLLPLNSFIIMSDYMNIYLKISLFDCFITRFILENILKYRLSVECGLFALHFPINNQFHS